MRSFVLAFADATFSPAAAFPIVYLAGTIITLRTWPPPPRPHSPRRAARVMRERRALSAVVKGGWA